MFSFLPSIVLAATLVNARQITSGEVHLQTVSLRGVVRAVLRDDIDSDFNWLVIGTPDGQVRAAMKEATEPLARLQRLRDAEIEITGSVRHSAGGRTFLGYQLFLDNPAHGIAVLADAPKDPYTAPDLTEADTIHRRKIRGRVLARTHEKFFLRTPDGHCLGVRPIHPDGMPAVGASVAAVGFVESDLTLRVLVEALWRTEPDTAHSEENVLAIPTENLFLQDGLRRHANTDLNGKFVRLAGAVTSVAGSREGAVKFHMDRDDIPIAVDLSGVEGCPAPEVGATVEVTGLCTAEFSRGESTIVLPPFNGFVLIPRSAADVRIVRAAPWWTSRRLAAALAAILPLLALFIGWTILLQRRAARQAHELVRQKLAESQARVKVEERTRLAVELHDSLSQTLTGVALQIAAARKSDPEHASGFLATAERMLSVCRQELRGCLSDLRTRTFAETHLSEAIHRALASNLGDARLFVRFNVPRKRLNETTVHAILRIIRELATNAVAHGGAKTIRIAGERRDGAIRFVVADDGSGFDPKAAPGPAEGHFGLQGVRERLNTLGGSARIESTPGKGTRVTVTMEDTGGGIG